MKPRAECVARLDQLVVALLHREVGRLQRHQREQSLEHTARDHASQERTYQRPGYRGAFEQDRHLQISPAIANERDARACAGRAD